MPCADARARGRRRAREQVAQPAGRGARGGRRGATVRVVAARLPGGLAAELLDGSTPAAAVVCGSDAVLAEQRRAAPSLRAVKIGYGIAVQDVVAQRGAGRRVRHALGAGTAPLIGMVGRLARAKRQDLFLRAAARIARARHDARFVIIGGEILGSERDYAEDLPTLADALGISDRVVFAGHRADAYAWIDALDVLVHPADREPYGLVIAEALALGKAVVAADAAGPAEILAGRGTLVAPDDHAALADGILAALTQPRHAGPPPRGADRMAADFAQLLDDGRGMRILDVSPRVTNPPARGSSVRTAALLGGLAERHEVRQLSQARLRAGSDPEAARGSVAVTPSYSEERIAPLLPTLATELGARAWVHAPVLSGLGLRRSPRLRALAAWADVVLVEFPWQYAACRRRGLAPPRSCSPRTTSRRRSSPTTRARPGRAPRGGRGCGRSNGSSAARCATPTSCSR